jgi:hypothetical protein
MTRKDIIDITLTASLFVTFSFLVKDCEGAEIPKHSIYAGIGYHSEDYDCPEVCYGGNKLAIVEYTYQHTEYTAAKILHISNYEITESGYGTNAIFYGVNIKW